MNFSSKVLLKVSNLSENKKKKKSVKIWNRNLIILKDFVGVKFKVYQGFKFINLLVSEEMVGFKFGEFAPTRVRHEYKKKKVKGKK